MVFNCVRMAPTSSVCVDVTTGVVITGEGTGVEGAVVIVEVESGVVPGPRSDDKQPPESIIPLNN